MSEKNNKKAERESIIKSLRILEYSDEEIDISLKEHGYEGLHLDKQQEGQTSIFFSAFSMLILSTLGFIALGIFSWARAIPENFTTYFPMILIIITMAAIITIIINVSTSMHRHRAGYVTKNTWESDFIVSTVFSMIIFFYAQYIHIILLIFMVIIPAFLMLISTYKLLFEEAFPAVTMIGLIAFFFAYYQPEIMQLLVNTIAKIVGL